jgi:hypothetical protein
LWRVLRGRPFSQWDHKFESAFLQGGVTSELSHIFESVVQFTQRCRPQWDPRFESAFLQRRVRCEPDFLDQARNLPPFRDPAVLLIDQLKEIYIDGELELIDTPVWFPRLAKKDFTIGLNLIGNGVDEPDQTLYEKLYL